MKVYNLDLINFISDLEEIGFVFDSSICTVYTITKWFRDTHKLHIEAMYFPNASTFSVIVSRLDIRPKDLSEIELSDYRKLVVVNKKFSDYEDGLKAGIEHAIKNFKVLKSFKVCVSSEIES